MATKTNLANIIADYYEYCLFADINTLKNIQLLFQNISTFNIGGMIKKLVVKYDFNVPLTEYNFYNYKQTLYDVC